MCGISGFLDLETGVDTDVLQRMTAVIRHRGPDDEGYALIGRTGTAFYGGADTLPQLALPPLKGCPPAEAFLGLGHRRLSILDLSAAGHQPMFLPERDLVLTYNGEIYNYLELRDQMESLGYRFRTACDTEVLLYAYCQWGEDCLSHFNGMWGFALWDGQEQKLFCARDRLGAKPFHYCRRGNRLLFGSELKQLCQDPAAEKRFNRQTLAANLMYRISDFNDQTLIQGMQVLPPGHKLVVRVDPEEGRITSLAAAPYWTLSVTYDHGKTEDQWAEEVAEEFQKTFGPQRENELLYPNGKPGKYQLDLWRANEIVLLEAGIRQENIHTAGICTCCNPELLYSHRKMGEKRGNLCAFLSLKLQKEQ